MAAAAAVLWLTVCFALAEEAGGFTYQVKPDGTAAITGCANSGGVVIPEQLNGHTVTSLARELFFARGGITSVSLPATVTYFGDDPGDSTWDYVFSYCFDLKAIHVAQGNPAFMDVDGVLYSRDGRILYNYPCARAGSVYHVPAKTRTICCTAFASSANLKEVYLDGGNAIWFTYTFFNDGDLTVYYPPDSVSAGRADLFIQNGLSRETSDEWNRFQVLGAEEPEPLSGDVNGDGQVDGRDLVRLAKHMAGDSVSVNEKAADLTGDGLIDGRDVLRLAKKLAGV